MIWRVEGKKQSFWSVFDAAAPGGDWRRRRDGGSARYLDRTKEQEVHSTATSARQSGRGEDAGERENKGRRSATAEVVWRRWSDLGRE